VLDRHVPPVLVSRAKAVFTADHSLNGLNADRCFPNAEQCSGPTLQLTQGGLWRGGRVVYQYEFIRETSIVLGSLWWPSQEPLVALSGASGGPLRRFWRPSQEPLAAFPGEPKYNGKRMVFSPREGPGEREPPPQEARGGSGAAGRPPPRWAEPPQNY